jgi:hypothetical protein
MILENGTIRIKSKTGGGLDADGYPVAPVVDWLEPIPASIVPAKLNYLAKSPHGSNYVDVSYTALIEYEELRVELLRKSERVWLEWQGVSGEFPVIRIEPLRAVDLIKIIV